MPRIYKCCPGCKYITLRALQNDRRRHNTNLAPWQLLCMDGFKKIIWLEWLLKVLQPVKSRVFLVFDHFSYS